MDERLDSDAVARVLARAQRIEADTHPADPIDAGRVSDEALIAAAAEVGIDVDAVRDSLAIERLPLAVARPVRVDRLVGPKALLVERRLALPPEAAIAALEDWLSAVHRWRVERRPDGSLCAWPRSDAAARLGRFTTGLRGEGRLGGVQTLTVVSAPLTAGAPSGRAHSLVRVVAARAVARQRRIGGGTALGAGSVATTATGIAESIAAWPVLSLPLLAGGYLVARSGRAQADRVELEIEHLLSCIERGDTPPTLLGRAAGLARRAVTSAVRQVR